MKSLINYASFGAAMLVIGWFGGRLFPSGEGMREVGADVETTVTVATATSSEFNPPTEYVGHVEPAETTDILPQIDGYLRKVCFTEGAHVSAGDLLFEIDDEQYVAARNLRYSEVRSAEAKVRVAQAEVDRAERYFRRLESADDRGITATERDNAETTLASAKAALNSANAAVEQAKAAAAIADFNLKHTKVYSPMTGRIGKAFHYVGDYVSPSKSALAKVVKLDPIRVVFPITDKDYDSWQAAAERGGSALKDSRRLRLRLASGEEYRDQGTIEFGDNEMNRQTGTLVMYVSFPNRAGRLVPNAFVRIISDEAKPPQALTVPSGAVTLCDEGTHVWTVDERLRAHSVSVEVGMTWNGKTQVKAGLEEGARVVCSGGFKLKDGMAVRDAAEPGDK